MDKSRPSTSLLTRLDSDEFSRLRPGLKSGDESDISSNPDISTELSALRRNRKASWDVADKLKHRPSKPAKFDEVANWNVGLKPKEGGENLGRDSEVVGTSTALPPSGKIVDRRLPRDSMSDAWQESISDSTAKILQDMAKLQSKIQYERKKRLLLEMSMLGAGLDLPDMVQQEQSHELNQLEQSVMWLKGELSALRLHLQLLQLKWIDKVRADEARSSRLSGNSELDNRSSHLQWQLEWTLNSQEVERQLNDQLEEMLEEEGLDFSLLAALVDDLDVQKSRPSPSLPLRVKSQDQSGNAGRRFQSFASPKHEMQSFLESGVTDIFSRQDTSSSAQSYVASLSQRDERTRDKLLPPKMPDGRKTTEFDKSISKFLERKYKDPWSKKSGDLVPQKGKNEKVERGKVSKELRKFQKELDKQMDKERKETKAQEKQIVVGKVDASKRFSFLNMRFRKKDDGTVTNPGSTTHSPSYSMDLEGMSSPAMIPYHVENFRRRPTDLAEEILRCMIEIYNRHANSVPGSGSIYTGESSNMSSPMSSDIHPQLPDSPPALPNLIRFGDQMSGIDHPWNMEIGVSGNLSPHFSINSTKNPKLRSELSLNSAAQLGMLGTSPTKSGSPSPNRLEISKSLNLISSVPVSPPRPLSHKEESQSTDAENSGQNSPLQAAFSSSGAHILETRMDRLHIDLLEIESALREISGQQTLQQPQQSILESSSSQVTPPVMPTTNFTTRTGSKRESGRGLSLDFKEEDIEGFFTDILDVMEIPSMDSHRNDPYGVMGRGHPCPNAGEYSKCLEITSVPKDSLRLGIDSALYTKFRVLTLQLEDVDPSALTHEEKLPFWINLYNALVMHTYLINGVPTNYMKHLSLLNKSHFTVGHHPLSALTIEYSILRARSHKPAMTKLLPPKPFKPGDECYPWVLSRPEPLVSFALSSGARSSPALQIFSVTNTRDELQVAKEDFLRAAVGLTDSNQILIPKIMDWYGRDFASTPLGVLEWIALHLGIQQRSAVTALINKSDLSSCVGITPFDWSFRYLLKALPARDTSLHV